MSKEQIINSLATYFNIKADTNSFDWNAGCSMGCGSPWLTLNNVVEALEDLCDEED